MAPVLSFESVSKQYQIGAGQSSLRSALAGLPRRFTSSRGISTGDDQHIWALRDVSFDLEAGQVLGIFGRNGAGKTTALKLLSRVTQPTDGIVRVGGRVSALIELGAGFHPDLTGRENIYLNGAILGLNRKEIARRLTSIVEFAELEKFIDTPVKRYSSGMYARLGFAVAAHSDPDVLLVDEVLAVGDLSFRAKCYDFIYSFVTSGKTAVFVSHDMYVLEQLCSRLIWLDFGRVAMSGEPSRVLSAYMDAMDDRAMGETTVNGTINGNFRLGAASFTDVLGRRRDTFDTGEDIVICLEYATGQVVEHPHFSIGIVGPNGGMPLFAASMLVDGAAPPSVDGGGVLRCRFRSVPLLPRTYSVWGEVWSGDRRHKIAPWQRLGSFRVRDEADGHPSAMDMGAVWKRRADAPVTVPYEWEY